MVPNFRAYECVYNDCRWSYTLTNFYILYHRTLTTTSLLKKSNYFFVIDK